MHELFLISDCADQDVLKATKLLQGFCAMAPVSIINRRLIWEAPRVAKQKGFDPQFLSRQTLQRGLLWRSLQDGLTRQAYHVNLVYAVSRDQFGASETSEEGAQERRPSTLDEIPGTIYWADWPDPKSTRPVNSRSAASVDNERGLCTMMRSMSYKLNKEIIEEGYRFIQGNVVIFLHRYLDLPSDVQEVANGPQPNLSTVLPAYESLVPFDSDNKWTVTATVNILNANDQEYMQKGVEELLSVKEAFHGYFDFPLLDRRMLDTRLRS